MPNVFEKHAQSVKQVQDYLDRAPGVPGAGAANSCPVFYWPQPNYQTPIRILPGSALRAKDLGFGGYNLRSDLRFIVRTADLPDPAPQQKQTIEYLNDIYRIDSIEKLSGGTLLRFECSDPTQGS